MIIIKTILVVLLSCLISCKMVHFNECPSIATYTKEEQVELERVRKEADSLILDKFLIDYYNLREDIKMCRGIKND